MRRGERGGTGQASGADLRLVVPSKAPKASRRILMISPTPVVPLLGGASARIRTLIGALEAIGLEVHFAFVQRDPGDVPAMRAMFGERFHSIPYRRQPAETSLVRRLRRRLLRMIGRESGWVWGVDDIHDSGIETPLAELHARLDFDVVIVEYVFFSRALRVFGPEVRKLVDMHDVFGNRHRMYVGTGQDSHWISLRPEDEIRALRRADHVLAIQPDEARLMRERGLASVDAVSHIVSLAAGPGELPAQPTALFVGAANDSNAQGLQWFVTEVWPSVLARCPQASLHVAGAVSKACPRAARVHAHGRVSDERLDELYGCARIAINPVFTGSGQSIKVLEAAGHGVPVVATSIGLRGIVGADEPGVLHAEDPADFAEALIRLFSDDEYAARARESAHAFARRSNSAQLEALERACDMADSRKTGIPPAWLAGDSPTAAEGPATNGMSEVATGGSTPEGHGGDSHTPGEAIMHIITVDDEPTAELPARRRSGRIAH